MFPAAYLRARKLASSRTGSLWLGHVLSVLQALMLVALVGVSGLILDLSLRRGVVRLPAARAAAIRDAGSPRWLVNRLPRVTTGGAEILLANTGLYPLAEENLSSRNPVHRVAARSLAGVLNRVPLFHDNLGALKVLLAMGLALLLGVAYAGLGKRSAAAGAAGASAASLRNQVHRQIYRLGQSALPSEGSGPVADLFAREVNDVRDGILAEIDHAWRMPVLAVGFLLLGLFASWQATIFLLALALLSALVARPLTRGLRMESDAATRDAAVRLCLLQDDLAMLRTVRVYGIEDVDRHRFDDHLHQFQEEDARRIRAEARATPVLLMVFGVGVTMAVGLLGYLLLTERLSPSTAAVVLVIAVGMAWPIARWLDLRAKLRQAGRSADAIFRYFDRRPELQQAVGARFLAPLKQRISLENVSLDGPNGRTLLSGISVEIPARSRTAILSLDESSKYAIACLIPRLIDPKVGRVRMDGLDLRDVTLESLRAQVALVLQADLIFNDTVTANIGLGDPSFGLPRIIEAAKVAHAHHLIQELPDGYDTPIGSLGHYLPVESQYRIALARAFLHDPSIVVIEEPNEALDDDTKHVIDDTIDRLAAGRTLIFLPHRLSTIRKCDRVIVLHSGRMEAHGTPREVHGQSKLYRHIQYVEFNQFATGEIEAGQMG